MRRCSLDKQRKLKMIIGVPQLLLKKQKHVCCETYIEANLIMGLFIARTNAQFLNYGSTDLEPIKIINTI